MARGNLDRVMPHVFAHEGGYVDDPQDPGGATKYGITLATLRAWRNAGIRDRGLGVGESPNPKTQSPKPRPVTKADVRALSVAEATAIYEANYARVVRFDDLPPGLDYAVLDFAINSGPKRAAEFLQKILGVEVDGVTGPKTCATAQTANPADTIGRLCDARLTFLKGLGTWKRFGKGWERRVREVREVALEMAVSVPSPLAGGAATAGEGRGGGTDAGIGPPPPAPPHKGEEGARTRQPDDPGVDPEAAVERPPSNAVAMVIGATVGLILLVGEDGGSCVPGLNPGRSRPSPDRCAGSIRGRGPVARW